MGASIALPSELNDLASMKYAAVFLNGVLLLPDQPGNLSDPGRLGDYRFKEFSRPKMFGDYASANRIEVNARVGALDMIQVTDFKSFRWLFTNGQWRQL